MSDLVPRMRQTWQEILDSDGAESEFMRDYREAADRIEAGDKAINELLLYINELEVALREISNCRDVVQAKQIAHRALEGKP